MKLIPYEKLSKKEKKKINNKKRNTWEINPVTRKEDRNKYKRKKEIPIED